MLQSLESGILRILRSDGKTVGTGFFVSKDLVVTCAHVVVTAEGLPGDTIQVQITGQEENIPALVVPEYWRDIKQGDVAVLRLEHAPQNIVPFRLGPAAQCQPGTDFTSFGYTTAADIQGIIARGTIDGYLKRHTLLQLQAPQANHGISGAPVIDEKRGVAVGMITKGHTELGRNELTTFATPAELFFEICPELQPSETCPYLGLDAFSEAEARFFHGRRRTIARLLESLQRNPRFLAVLGPSGCGKSSVVLAGLLPTLRNGALFASEKWEYFLIRPGDDPFLRLDSAVLPETSSGLIAALQIWTQTHPDAHPVLIVDQFEELFTATPPETRQKFLTQLAELLASDQPVTFILTLRDEFYSTFARQSVTLTRWLERSQVNVEATLSRDELREIIIAPAELVGLSFEPGLVETLLEDVTEHQTEGASTLLPLLEFSLTQLWEQRQDGLLTHAAYQKLGGVTGGLAAWAARAYLSIPATQRLLAQHVLTQLVHLGDETIRLPDTRRRMTLTDLTPAEISAEDVRNVLKPLTDARLLITQGAEVEIAHEVLIYKWGDLRQWLDEHRQELLAHQQLQRSTREWSLANRNKGLLYPAARASEIDHLRKRKYPFNAEETAFVQASQKEWRYQRLQKYIFWTATLILLGVVLAALPGRAIYQSYLRQNASNSNPLLDVEGGTFIFGTDDPTRFPEEPDLTTVKVKSFAMNAFEVTNQNYRACFDANICDKPKNTKYYDDPLYNQHPVVHVTFAQAETYCAWLGQRLPDTYQWELAARGKQGNLWPWGNIPEPSGETANINYLPEPGQNWNPPQGTLPVGSFPAGATSNGIFDLLGNVWEWTSTPAENGHHIQRGGSWLTVPYRITLIRTQDPEQADPEVGFRCIK